LRRWEKVEGLTLGGKTVDFQKKKYSFGCENPFESFTTMSGRPAGTFFRSSDGGFAGYQKRSVVALRTFGKKFGPFQEWVGVLFGMAIYGKKKTACENAGGLPSRVPLNVFGHSRQFVER